jgi:phosphomannomutase
MSFQIPPDLMVSVSGVRGRVGAGLTPEVVARFAAAFGAYIRERSGSDRPRIVLARDSRTSGPMFVRAVAAALQSVGCDVIDIGIAPTPTALFNIGALAADGGIVVTASHNPVEWNALKLASSTGMFLDADEAPLMHAFVNDRAIERASWDALGDVADDTAAVERHIRAVLGIRYLDIEALRRASSALRWTAYAAPASCCCRGCSKRSAARSSVSTWSRTGVSTASPSPCPDNLKELEQLVRESGADIGMATDPDSDRLALVSNEGRAIGEDYTLALATALVLRHNPG